MSEEQRAYHELEMMQELGMLEEGTNICEILDDYVEEKREMKEIKEVPSVELENHMVIGEYYDDTNSGGDGKND